jgi:hypothetical protein
VNLLTLEPLPCKRCAGSGSRPNPSTACCKRNRQRIAGAFEAAEAVNDRPSFTPAGLKLESRLIISAVWSGNDFTRIRGAIEETTHY